MNFSNIARFVAKFSASPQATFVSLLTIVLWFIFGPFMHFSDTWQLIMSSISGVITFAMVFVLNHAQARDTAAINAKLDALILANEKVDNKLIAIETATEADLEKMRLETSSSI